MAEATAEFRVGAAQRLFRVGVDVTADIDEGEDQVAELVGHLALSAFLQRFAQFGDFLLDLVENRFRLGPVEADLGGAFLDFQGFGQRRKTALHRVEMAVLFGRIQAVSGAACGAFGLFLRFDRIPLLLDGIGRIGIRAGEDMRMAADHFSRHRLDDVAEGKGAGFLGHAGMEDDLEKEVAEFVAEGVAAPRLGLGCRRVDRGAVLETFRREWPGIVVQVHTGANQQLLTRLKSGEMTLALGRMSDPEGMAGLTFEHLCATPLCVVVRPAHPLVQQRRVSMADLADHHVILPPHGTILRHTADSFLRAHGVGTLDDYSELLSMSLARAMTLRDDVVWIASEITVQDDLADGTLCALPFATKGTEESIGILWRNDTVPTPPEQTLISAMREAARVRYGVPGLR